MLNAFDQANLTARPETRPTVLLVAPLYPPAYRGGGPIRTTEAMVEAHGDRFRFFVITSNTDWGQTTPLDVPTNKWVDRGKAQVRYTNKTNPISLIRAIKSGASLNPDFVYLNSFLSPSFSLLPVTLARLGIFGGATVIMAPRGGFGAAALSLKSRKKKLLLAASRITGLHHRVIWHASSEDEAREIRKQQPSGEIIIRPNESNLPASAIRRQEPCGETVRLVFISRISEIKGVTLLLEALAKVRESVTISIYGTANDPRYIKECQRIASLLPQNIQCNFHDGVENSKVRTLFSEADAFFLPTEQENFGHAIAESLSSGCPVFVEDVTPWTNVVNQGGGKIVSDHTISAWARALNEYCSMPSDERTIMKTRAAEAYERWRADQDGPSVFELARPEISSI